MLKNQLIFQKIAKKRQITSYKIIVDIRNLHDTFETRKLSFISDFSICITVPLIKMLEKWKHLLDNWYDTGVLFMDLSKAYDMLSPFLFLQSWMRWIFSKIRYIYIKGNKKVNSVRGMMFNGMCNYVDDNTLCAYCKDFRQVWRIFLKKRL